MPTRDLGALGENALARWAAARGIAAQRVTVDRSGWDYLLEFPLEADEGSSPLPLDKVQAPITCLVQVKATSVGRLSFPIKLDNLQFLAIHSLPVFFLILHFGAGDTPEKAFLVHLNQCWISRVLHRIRALDSQSCGITGRTMSVKCVALEELAAPDGEHLERSIRQNVGASLEEYSEVKRRWNRDAGYESQTGNFTFRVSTENLEGVDLLDYLVDLSLGLREPLKLDYAEIRDVRFGIPAKDPLREPAEGVLDIVREPVAQVQVIVRCGTSSLRTEMALFLPRGLAGVVPSDRLKALLKGSAFDLVVARTGGSIRLHLPSTEDMASLRDLHDIAKLVILLNEISHTSKAARFRVEQVGQVLMEGALNLGQEMRPELLELGHVILDAWAVAMHCDLPEKLQVSIRQLLRQKERLVLFRTFLSPEAHALKIAFSGHRSLIDSRVCIPIGTEVMLGEYRCTTVFSVWGEVKFTDSKLAGEPECAVTTKERRVERVFAMRMDEQPTIKLNDMVNEIADSLKEPVTCLILEQYAS